MNAFCPSRVPNIHLARDEAPMFRPDYGIDGPPRRHLPRWLLWVLLAISLSVNAGLIAALAWIGGRF